MKLASLFLRFLQVRLHDNDSPLPSPRNNTPEHSPPSQFAASVVILALGIHLNQVYDPNYYPKHSMPTSSRYGAWSGGFGILTAGIGAVLTIVGKGHAILMIVLDALAGVFFVVCGAVRTAFAGRKSRVLMTRWMYRRLSSPSLQPSTATAAGTAPSTRPPGRVARSRQSRGGTPGFLLLPFWLRWGCWLLLA